MNPYLPREAEIVGRSEESPNTFSLHLRLTDGQPYDFAPGQFNMLYLYGSGEVPISIVADAEDSGVLTHTVRALGRVTNGLAALQGRRAHRPARTLRSRLADARGTGPRRGGGHRRTGLCALGLDHSSHPDPPRALRALEHPAGRQAHRRSDLARASTIPGPACPMSRCCSRPMSRNPAGTAMSAWSRRFSIICNSSPTDTLAMLCGPEMMMRACAESLHTRGLAADDIYLSMERNMQCAVGHCGHCQMGGHFVCRDGPVFRLARGARTAGREGFLR